MTTQSDPSGLQALTEKFFANISARKWDSALARIHPDARAIQNISGHEVNARDLLSSMQGLVESLADFSYENRRCIVGQQAVVEQHDVRMTRRDGVEVVIDICIVLRFDTEGLITRIDEYLDSGALKPLQN
ncbi:MAG: hypothetical protein CBC48_16990 [bacterium TMED88]|nr:hypothetical protein [Deltaproteobacteria bacterium]OUV24984.1 MAG: hypothetical protein CBC48_16990 [bacterium TMED88]